MKQTTIRDINAIARSGVGYAYALVNGERVRVIRARNKAGEVQVLVLATGKWATTEPSSLEVSYGSSR